MLLQTVSVIVSMFLAQVASDTGVHFVMERHPDSYFCGHLQCVANLSKSDQDVFTCVGMTIYDITLVNSELKLASVSAFHRDLYVDTTKSSAMSCTGIISGLHANLTLQLRHDIDCLYGVYKCQLDVVTESGHPKVLTEIVVPENNHKCSRAEEMINQIDTLTGVFNIHSNFVSNQTAEIIQLGSQLDNQTTKLTDQTAEISNLGSRLDDLTAQLINQNAQLHNMSQRLDLETTKQKQHYEAVEKRLMALDLKLDTIQKLLNQVADIFRDQSSCIKGHPHRNGTKRIALWGNTTALCDTTNDGEGWITMKIEQKGMAGKERYSFRCGRWLADNEDEKDIVRAISATTANIKKYLPCSHFVITVKTGDKADAGTDANVYIIMYSGGQNEDTSGKVWLHPGRFERKQTDILNVNVAKMSSPVTTIEVGHDDTRAASGWFLESVKGYNELRVEMLYQGRRDNAHYSNCYLASEAMNYRPKVGAYEGTATDSLTQHNNMYFANLRQR